jgi:hypothetical protein
MSALFCLCCLGLAMGPTPIQKVKVKAVRVHALKAYKGSRGIALLILNLSPINRPFLARIVPALATRIARGMWMRGTTGGESWNV